MVDMLWADEDGLINGVRHSLETKGRLEGVTDSEVTATSSDAGGDNASEASDNDDDHFASKSKSNFTSRNSSVAGSESRVSINGFDQNFVIPSQPFCAASLLAGVTYDPTSTSTASPREVSILMDGNDLSKIKHLLLITSLVDISADDDDASQVSGGSRLLSPLARKTRSEAERNLEDSMKEIKNNIVANSRYVNSLSLKYCKLNEKGLFKLFASLRNNDSVTALNLCGNVFTTDNTSASLGNLLNFNHALCTLNVQETNMGNVGATLVAQALHINKYVTSLNLSANKIDAQGCVMLASALKENQTLTHLNLSRNIIGARGVQTLAQSLHNNRHLLHLDLGRQKLKGKIGQEGAKHLALCLMMNHTLRILRLGRNRLGFEGCRHISGALLTNRTLQVLDLSCNKIGIEGAIQVANAVLQNGALEYVIIGHRRLPVCHLIGHFHENKQRTEGSFTFNFQDNSAAHENQITENFVNDAIEKAVDAELSFDYNIYFASDKLKVQSDAVFNATKSDFTCIDFQVIPCEFDVLGGKGGSSSRSDVRSNGGAGACGAEATGAGGMVADQLAPVFSVSDEEAVFIAHLVKDNARLEALRIDHTFLPVQQLRGRPYQLQIEDSGIIKQSDQYDLDLSDSLIKCPDAVVIGILIADNPRLKLISLHGNDFSKTEGETWISSALAKNPRIGINTAHWSAEEMYADGYHQLAALKGISASGAAIMPQRLEDWFDKLCLIGGAAAFYLDFSSDVYVTYLYSQDPETYQTSWVVLSAVFLSLPTCNDFHHDAI